MTRRLAVDHGHLAEGFAMRYVTQALRDWKVYVFGLMGMAAFTAIYSFSLFLPTIVKAMGYSANTAQLMSVPPYVVACMATIGTNCKQHPVFFATPSSVNCPRRPLFPSSQPERALKYAPGPPLLGKY